MNRLMKHSLRFLLSMVLTAGFYLHAAADGSDQGILSIEGGHNRKILLINVDPLSVAYGVTKSNGGYVFLQDRITFDGRLLSLTQSQRWSNDDGYIGPYHFAPEEPKCEGGRYISHKGVPYLLIPSSCKIRIRDVSRFLKSQNIEELLDRPDYEGVAKALAREQFPGPTPGESEKLSAFLLVGKKTLDHYATAAPAKFFRGMLKKARHK